MQSWWGLSSDQPTATCPAPGEGPSHVLRSSWKWPEEQAQGCLVPAQVSNSLQGKVTCRLRGARLTQ